MICFYAIAGAALMRAGPVADAGLSRLTRSGNRGPSWALAALVRQVRISPSTRLMPTWFLWPPRNLSG